MMTIVLFDMLVLIILLTLGVPLSFCFGGALLFMSIFTDVSMKGLFLWGFNQIINPILLTIPLFVLAGGVMSESGIAKYLLNFVNAFIGRLRGGLGVVAVVTCAIIGAISGSGLTGVAAIGPILIPQMAKEKYPRGYATALVTCSSILGLLIPPSTIMIIYGWVTETSILACFLATVGPGLLIVVAFSIINLLFARKMPLLLSPPMEAKVRKKKILNDTWKAIPALSMPVIILGGIYGGVFTPTEAAAVAVVISLPIGFLIYRGLKLNNFYSLVKESATSVGTIMIMILLALMLSQVFVMNRIPQAIISFMFGITTNRFLLLFMINILLFIIGMLVNDATGMVLAAPLLLPLVKELGITPVQFAAIMGTNLAMGGVTPPYASILYLGMRVGKVGFLDILKPTLIFIIFGYVPVVFLTTYWPTLSLFLPRLLGFAP
jgi:tripartite ATP-independent transporter DctM subunit